jgi:hypothetical protein
VQEAAYIGIDLHRRRSVVVALGKDGGKFSAYHIDNDAVELVRVVTEAAGEDAEVVLEACYDSRSLDRRDST